MCSLKQIEKCANSSGNVFKLSKPRNNLLALMEDNEKQKIVTVKMFDPSSCFKFMLGKNVIIN